MVSTSWAAAVSASGDAPVSLTPEAVGDAVREASVPTLLATLVQLTGSIEWLNEKYRPARSRGLSESIDGGLDPVIQEQIRTAAAGAIAAWLGGVAPAIERPTKELALRILSFSVGEPVPEEYAEYLEHDLIATTVTDEGSDDALSGLTALIVGAGVSGIAAAIKLMRRGATVVIVEKTADVGGTWNVNRYPGCGVDTASHLYSYSFAPYDWEYYYAPQGQLKGYLQHVAREFGVLPQIRFRTEVTGASFDTDLNTWTVEVSEADGPPATVRCDVLITAVGAFGRPSLPRIEGLETFSGATYHTADWPDNADLQDKRVSVIGTGASAMQLVPAVAGIVRHLTIFQRSPQWAAPFEQFHLPVPGGVRSLLAAVPVYRSWYRARLGWLLNDKIHASLQIDPDWPDLDHSINAINDGHRRFFTRYIEDEIGSDTELLEKVIPPYPPFGKRMLLDNRWFRTLRRPNVDLVAQPIVSIDETGVTAADGSRTETDVLVLATGFDVVHYLVPMQIRGVRGQFLSEVWDGDNARAYLGIAMPGFPNLFCLYGPNGAPGHGGSYINTVECQLDYLVDLLVKMRREGAAAVDCKQDIHDKYNVEVDAANERMIWSHPGFSTYYRNSRGRVVYTNPWRIVDFWHMTRAADLSDFNLRLAQ